MCTVRLALVPGHGRALPHHSSAWITVFAAHVASFLLADCGCFADSGLLL
jgi:hypothetical protein